MEPHHNLAEQKESLSDADLEKKFGSKFCQFLSHEFVRKYIRLVGEKHKGESPAVYEMASTLTSNDDVIVDQMDESLTTDEMRVESQASFFKALDLITVQDSIPIRRKQLMEKEPKSSKQVDDGNEKENSNVVENTQSQVSKRTISSTDLLALPEYSAVHPCNDFDLPQKEITENQAAVDQKKSKVDDNSNELSTFPSKQPKRLPYTDEEDRQIIEYIIRTDRFLDVKGNGLYKDMEREGVNYPRTWASMRDRILKSIVPKLEENAQRLNLSQENVRKILFATRKVRRTVVLKSSPQSR